MMRRGDPPIYCAHCGSESIDHYLQTPAPLERLTMAQFAAREVAERMHSAVIPYGTWVLRCQDCGDTVTYTAPLGSHVST